MLEFEICRADHPEGQIGVKWGEQGQAGIREHKLEPTGHRLESTLATLPLTLMMCASFTTHTLGPGSKESEGDHGELANEVNPRQYM